MNENQSDRVARAPVEESPRAGSEAPPHTGAAATAPAASDNGSHPRAEDVDPGTQEFGRYVYCIVQTNERLELGPLGIGEGENEVYSVHHGELAAIVSDTPVKLYDPTRENLLAHELVNEIVLRDHSVVPVSFGTIFRTEADVVELLRSTGAAFSEVLRTIYGKVELGLKVIWDRDRVVSALEEENDGIRGLKEEIANTAKGSTYFARVQIGRLIEDALEERANDFLSQIYSVLRPLAVASQSNKLIGDSMILNGAFLVERSRIGEFDDAVRALSDQHRDILSFKYTGPWPPYNFVNVKLKLERAR